MFERWVKTALKRGKISQAEMARQLTEALGRSIDRAAVNKLTKSGRDLAADEMLEIARITRTPIPGSNLTNVPLIDFVSAGRLTTPGTQIPVEDAQLLVLADLGRGEFFALTVQGDSMDRISPDGSVIVFNSADRELVSGKAYVFSLRGETGYKLWRPDPPRLSPYSTNPANEPKYVKRMRDLEVIGRVRRTVLDL